MPSLPDAVDPTGKHFVLSSQGKAALGFFLLAGVWWVFEVMPIGVTSIAIGVVQALFAIRSAKDAFRDFMDPSVMFIFGSLLIGLAFTKSGLTRRLAYKMLSIIGENTKAILLGTMIITAALAHFMAHTAAAATVFPILMAIYSLYGEGDRPTKFGKALIRRHGLFTPAPAVSPPCSVRPGPRPGWGCLRNLPGWISPFLSSQSICSPCPGSWFF